MTALQKLQIEQSEKRQRLNALLAQDERSDTEATELATLTTRMQALEPELRAAIVAAPEEAETTIATGDAESRERAELRAKVSLGEYASAAAEARSIAGAEAEYNDALGISKRPGAFPLELLVSDDDEPEKRATTDAESDRMPRRWIDRLFAQSAAMAVGVTMESVMPGTPSYMVTTAGATGEQQDRSEATGDAAWTVGVTSLKPKRGSVRAVFSLEDSYRMPGLEDALQRDLRMALVESVDEAIFSGDTGPSTAAYDITGLRQAGITEFTLTQANKVKGVNVLARLAALIDGKHATSPSDLRIVASVGTNILWLTTIINSAASNETLAQFLRASGISWTTRADIDTATTNGKYGLYCGLGRGIEGAAVAAMWAEGQLIRDPFSAAGKGEVSITLSTFWDFALPRTSSFRRLKYVT